MVAGGGVRGKGDGIVRGAMIQVGATIETFHPSIAGYHQVGGMTIGKVVGRGGSGTTNKYPTNRLNATGATGKRAGIGSKKVGASKGSSPQRAPGNEKARCGNRCEGGSRSAGKFNKVRCENRGAGKRNNKSEKYNNPGRNAERRSNRNDLKVEMKNLKEGREKSTAAWTLSRPSAKIKGENDNGRRYEQKGRDHDRGRYVVERGRRVYRPYGYRERVYVSPPVVYAPPPPPGISIFFPPIVIRP